MSAPWITQVADAAGGGESGEESGEESAERRAAVVDSLIAFSEAGVLKRAAYHAAALHAPADTAAVKQMRIAFKELDVDASGVVSRDEFLQVMSGRQASGGVPVDAEALFDALDVRGTGAIEWRWFLAATLDAVGGGRGSAGKGGGGTASGGTRGGVTEGGRPAVVDAFLLLDTDGDGIVTPQDIAVLLASSPDPDARKLGESEASVIALLQQMSGEYPRLTQ